jgi:hypothetical protein
MKCPDRHRVIITISDDEDWKTVTCTTNGTQSSVPGCGGGIECPDPKVICGLIGWEEASATSPLATPIIRPVRRPTETATVSVSARETTTVSDTETATKRNASSCNLPPRVTRIPINLQ